MPSAWFVQARQLLLRRGTREGSEGRGRGLDVSVEVLKDLFDHRRIFDARDDLDRATTVLAGLDIDLEHPLQSLRLRLIDTWRAGAGWSVVCALHWSRRAGVTCSRHRWFGAKTP